MYADGDQMPPRKAAVLGMSGQLKSIVKHMICGLRTRMSCVKTVAPTLTISRSYDNVSPKGRVFWGVIDNDAHLRVNPPKNILGLE